MRLRSGVLGFFLCCSLAGCSSSETTTGHGSQPGDAGSDASDASADVGTDGDGDAAADTGPDGPVTSAGSCGAVSWGASYGGGPKGDLLGSEQATGAVYDANGNAWVVGHYRGAADFGGGALTAGAQNRSLFVLELDPAGKHLASRGFGDPSDGLIYAPAATAHGVALAPGGGPVVVGSFAGSIDFGTGLLSSNDTMSALDAGAGCLSCAPDILVLALDAQGQTVWAKRWGDADSDAALAVAVDPSGAAYVAGDFTGSLDFGLGSPLVSAGGTDAFVVKLDASGSPLWAVAGGGAKDDAAYSLALTASGDVVVGGAFTSSASFGGTPLATAGSYDGFLLVISSGGSVKSARALGASQRGGVAALAARPAGGYFAGGWARGSVSLAGQAHSTLYDDAFVLAVDSNGTESWAQLFGTADNDQTTALAPSPGGHVVLAASVGVGMLDLGGGPLGGNLSDGTAMLELDESGSHVCSRRFSADSTGEPIGDSGMTLGASIDPFALATGPSGEALLAGALTGRTTLGPIVLTSSAGTDVMVVRFAPP